MSDDSHNEVPVEPQRGSRGLNVLSLIFVSLSILAALYYTFIFLVPNTPLNPFPPVEIPSQVVVVINTPEPTFPPTWTPTPTPLPVTPRTPATPAATSTPRPTRTPLPTETPTPSITPTPSPDLCTTLKLMGPPLGQHYNQYDNADLSWSFGRPLTAFEHFDILVAPPDRHGAPTTLTSVTWGDEANPANKDCTSYCTFTLALGSYNGGRFNWTIEVLQANKDRKVLGTICKAPPPYFFSR